MVAQSTAKAEYISTATAANQAIWLGKILSDLEMDQTEATVIFCDNKSAIAVAKNPVQHRRTKHINVKFHALREADKNSEINLKYCSSDEQLADIFTKALHPSQFHILLNKMSILNIHAPLEGECETGK